MKVVFLDVDGVLNTSETFERVYGLFKNTGKKELEIDLFRLEYLKQIIDETDAKIVLSSAWRRFFDKIDNKIVPLNEKGREFNRLLNNYGIEIYDKLNNDFCSSREELVIGWLSKRDDVENFIMIDDEPSLFDSLLDKLIVTSKTKRYQILTNMDDCYGLCENHIEVAKEMLNRKVKIKK